MTLDSNSYGAILATLKTQVRGARLRAQLAVNAELLALYWQIGQAIVQAQAAKGWGARVIESLSKDLHAEFPDMTGFSVTNLKYMRMFALAYPVSPIGQQPVDQLPWGHLILLLTKVKDVDERLWYALAAREHGWSRNLLAIQIDTNLKGRQGQAVTNFRKTLPDPQSDLAQDTLKDPYAFDFLTGSYAHERDVERGLVEHLKSFMLELGQGFAFVGQQVHLEVAGEDYYLDLLFYHLRLRCYVVIDLKYGAFKPEFAGKMNFYLSAVDDLLRHKQDAPSIGLILCRSQNRMIAEYALRDLNKPMGVSTYDLGQALPAELLGVLPTVEQLETELAIDAVPSDDLDSNVEGSTGLPL